MVTPRFKKFQIAAHRRSLDTLQARVISAHKMIEEAISRNQKNETVLAEVEANLRWAAIYLGLAVRALRRWKSTMKVPDTPVH